MHVFVLGSSDPSSFFSPVVRRISRFSEKKKERAPDSSLVLCLRYTEGKHTQYKFLVSSVSLRSCPPCISMAVVRRRAFFFPSLLQKKTHRLVAGKTGSKTCNVFCNIAAKRIEKRCYAFYHQGSNLSCDKSGCCRLRK